MNMEEINAVLGIDTNAATRDMLIVRAVEFCGEMADCYKPDTLEHTAFVALRYALYRALVNGGNCDAD